MARRASAEAAPASPEPAGDANRRADVLRAAARLFVEKGFHATTTRDIAEAAGMRSGSPFYHFRSKQEMLKTAMIEGIEAGLARIHAAIAGVDDPEERLRRMMRTHLANLLEGDCNVPMLLYEWRALDAAARAEVAAVTDRYQRPWQETIDALAAAGKLREGGPVTRLLLFGMLNWSNQWYRPDGACTLDAITEQALRLWLAPP